ncbi:MAG: porin [Pseudomonadota bacterium]
MKSKFLAFAVLASAAATASAQSSVVIYGVLDGGITSERGGAEGNVTKVSTGVQSGSRLGFKGTEDLGNGLKAKFQLENGFDLDTGRQRQGGLLFGRQAWLGLSGDFGTVALGRQNNPLFVALDSFDAFETGLSGSTTNLMNPGSVRVNNSVTYSLPSFKGVSGTVMYGLGEVAGDSKAGRTLGASLGYANGPLALTAAYDRQNLAANKLQKLALVAGTYDFGVLKAHLGFETEKNDSVVGGFDNRDYMAAVTVPVGTSGQFLANFIKRQSRNDNAVGGRQVAIAYLYALSKRTNAYTSFGNIRNDSAGTNFVGDASSGGSAPLPGDTSRALSVGIRHKF